MIKMEGCFLLILKPIFLTDPSSMYAVLQDGDVTAYKMREKVNVYQKSCQTWSKISRKLLKDIL